MLLTVTLRRVRRLNEPAHRPASAHFISSGLFFSGEKPDQHNMSSNKSLLLFSQDGAAVNTLTLPAASAIPGGTPAHCRCLPREANR